MILLNCNSYFNYVTFCFSTNTNDPALLKQAAVDLSTFRYKNIDVDYVFLVTWFNLPLLTTVRYHLNRSLISLLCGDNYFQMYNLWFAVGRYYSYMVW